MLYGSEDHDVSGDKENFECDPYAEDEADPAKCRAAESSLWEVVALQNHVLPQVSLFLVTVRFSYIGCVVLPSCWSLKLVLVLSEQLSII